jgi:anti-sigma factor RsiW
MAKHAARRTTKNSTGHRHGQGKGHCLRILRELSAYIDDELSGTICGEIRRHLGACPNCEDFVASLRQTVALCRHKPVPSLSSLDRARMRDAILREARLQ